jgi:hypothetical protein
MLRPNTPEGSAKCKNPGFMSSESDENDLLGFSDSESDETAFESLPPQVKITFSCYFSI